MGSNQVLVISQARMTSTRLPGKVLMKVNDKTLLEYHIERLSKLGLPLVVATTTNVTDDPIVELCDGRGISVFRGSELDVLERFYLATNEFQAEHIIRVTSDCPLVDADLIKEGLEQYQSVKSDSVYLSNGLERTFPRGFDFEIFSNSLLKEAYENATLEGDREHVTPYIWNNRSGRVNIIPFVSQDDYSRYRITVDQREDFQLIETLIKDYQAEKLNHSQIIKLFLKRPELTKINSHVEQKKA